jgi:4-hydroxybenzoate polyprenyltransferase
MTLREKLDAYEKLMRLDKPIGILLLLWPVLWGLWLSAPFGALRLDVVIIFIIGTVLTRSAGCIVNDYADRNFDAHVARTRDRPIAAGRVSPKEALVLAAALFLLAFMLVLFLNKLTIMLSFVALALAVTYPFLKRFFAFPQAYLGIAFGISIPMAYAAQQGKIAPVAWALLLGNVFWAIAYDTGFSRHHDRGGLVAQARRLLLLRSRAGGRFCGAPVSAHHGPRPPKVLSGLPQQ